MAQLLAGRDPSVLLYHGVPRQSQVPGAYAFDADAFERQLTCLQSHFYLIHPHELSEPRSVWKRKAVLLTFDDGFQNNATTVAAILRKHRIPALFFVSNRHIGTRRLLWFSYLRALELRFPGSGLIFRGIAYDMSPRGRAASVQALMRRLLELRPHPQAMYAAIADELPPWESFVSPSDAEDWFLGMTEDQLRELASDPLFSIEAHTVDHPWLTKCEPTEAVRQLEENKAYIEGICSKKVTAISYPSGDYNEGVLEACRQLGYTVGFAVIPSMKKSPGLEIPRAGIYRPEREVAVFKAFWARWRLYNG